MGLGSFSRENFNVHQQMLRLHNIYSFIRFLVFFGFVFCFVDKRINQFIKNKI